MPTISQRMPSAPPLPDFAIPNSKISVITDSPKIGLALTVVSTAVIYIGYPYPFAVGAATVGLGVGVGLLGLFLYNRYKSHSYESLNAKEKQYVRNEVKTLRTLANAIGAGQKRGRDLETEKELHERADAMENRIASLNKLQRKHEEVVNYMRKRRQEEIEKRIRQEEALTAQVTSLVEANKKNEAKICKIEEENQDLKKENSKLVRKLNASYNREDRQQQHICKIKKENQDLDEENQDLKKENSQLVRQLDASYGRNSRQRQHINPPVCEKKTAGKARWQ